MKFLNIMSTLLLSLFLTMVQAEQKAITLHFADAVIQKTNPENVKLQVPNSAGVYEFITYPFMKNFIFELNDQQLKHLKSNIIYFMLESVEYPEDRYSLKGRAHFPGNISLYPGKSNEFDVNLEHTDLLQTLTVQKHS